MSRLNRTAKAFVANKEDGQFKEALTLYESKQYKKSLKIVDQILKKHSGYSSALALKGVLLENTGEKSESEDYVIRGLEKGPNDYVTHHLAGIYYRAKKDYTKAAKYLQLTLDKGSPNKTILKDLATMLTQTRNYKPLAAARLAFLEEQPGYRAHWTAAAVAHHLNKDYDYAEKVLIKIENLIEGKLKDTDLYENSELALYKNKIIGESGRIEDALKDIEIIEEKQIVRDGISLKEYKAKYLMLLGRKKEASLIYRELLKINPDNASYYYLLETALGTSNSSPTIRKALYAKLAKFYPKSDPVHYIPLTFLRGEDFKKAVTSYTIGQLERGCPSTFVNVKPLYKNSKNRDTILQVVLEFFETKAASVSPLTWCWSAYFLAQHYYYIKDQEKALKYINLAIEHTPTLVEPYIVKARILKRLNKLNEAAEVMNEGRSIDLQDRFINTKTTKYYLRSNQVEKAIDTIGLFTKEEPVKDLHTMQSVWFVLESAEAYWRLYKECQSKKLSEEDFEDEDQYQRAQTVLLDQAKEYRAIAIKRFEAVSKIYDEYYDDQLDFHIYSMRCGTARAYMEMLTWGDKLYKQPIYTRVIVGISQLYFDIFDEILVASSKSAEEQVHPKKKSKKDKKDDIKRREELLKYATAYDKETDEDVLGEAYVEKLFKDGKPLDDLVNTYYNRGDKENVEINYVGFKINKNLKKYILCLQNITKVESLTGGSSALIGSMFVQLKHASESDDTIQVPIKKILDMGLLKSFPDLTKVEDVNERLDLVSSRYFKQDNFETALAIIETLKIAESDKLITRLDDVKSKIDAYSSDYLKYYQ